MAFNLRMMQVVLNKDVKKLGYRGEVVEVKPGFFRNFLFPNRMADVATPSRLRVAESRKDKLVMKKQQVLENAQEVIEGLKGLKITITEKVNDKGHLYAAVSESEIVEAVEAASKVKLAPEWIKMEQIKEVGEYSVLIHLAKDMEETITVIVEASNE